MNGAETKSSPAGVERLREHARDCAECNEAPLPLNILSAALDRDEAPQAVLTLSRRVLEAATPLLALHAKRAYRKRLALSLVLTLGPLPVVAVFDVYMLREAYGVLSGWLPAPLAAWILVGYATMLLLLCALTYAALPLYIARPPRTEARGWSG